MLAPMLAQPGPLPHGPDWAFEFKWDGMRAIAVSGPKIRLYARSGTDLTARYPELAALPIPAGAVLDGEVVVLHDGVPSFALLAERMHTDRPPPALVARVPVTYLVFDLLALGGEDLCPLPYSERRARLEALGLQGPHWAVPPGSADGAAMFAASAELGLEGVVAKRLRSPYRPGVRSGEWVKCRHDHTMDVLVGGWRPGARALGALLVGTAEPEGLTFRGRVGGGISAAAERHLLELLAPLERPTPPFDEHLSAEDRRGTRWVEPLVVVEVAYGQVTPAGRLRFPRFRKVVSDA